MSFQPSIELNTTQDFRVVINNFESLASMLARKLYASTVFHPTALFLIPFYTNNDEVIFAGTIMGELQFIRTQRGSRDFSPAQILDVDFVHSGMDESCFDEVVRNLSNPAMVAYAVDVRKNQLVDIIKLHKDGVPYVKVKRLFLD